MLMRLVAVGDDRMAMERPPRRVGLSVSGNDIHPRRGQFAVGGVIDDDFELADGHLVIQTRDPNFGGFSSDGRYLHSVKRPSAFEIKASVLLSGDHAGLNTSLSTCVSWIGFAA